MQIEEIHCTEYYISHYALNFKNIIEFVLHRTQRTITKMKSNTEH